MRHLYHLAPILLVLFAARTAVRAEPDVERSYYIHFEISGDREDGYDLESRTVIAQTFTSQRATLQRGMSFGAPFYAPYDRFDVFFRDHYIDDDDIREELDNDEDIFLSGQTLHRFELPADVRVGDSMAVIYEQEYSSPVYLPMLLVPNVDRLREYRVEIEHPEDVTVDFDMFFPGGAIDYTVEHPEDDLTVFVIRNLEKRPDMPEFAYNDLQCAAQIWLHDSKGTINAASTPEFLDWYSKQFDRSASLPGTYDTLLSGAMATAATPREKVRVINDYVRSTIRYIADERGASAIVPRLPGQVLERGYGDCKDRAFLVSAIARRYGLRVDPVLLSTVARPQFRGTHVWQFNHVICAYGSGDDRIFFDPTARLCAFGNLPHQDVGANALVLEESRAEKVRIPMPRTEPTLITIEGDVADAKHCNVHAELHGDLLYGARWILDGGNSGNRRNALERLLSDELQKISFDGVDVVTDEPGRIVLEGTADLSRFIIAGSHGRRYVPRLAFAVGDADLTTRSRDTFAIYPSVRSPLELRLDLKAVGAAVDDDSTAIAAGGASFRAAAGRSSDRMHFEYGIALLDPYIAGADRRPFLTFYQSLLESRSAVFTISPAQQ